MSLFDRLGNLTDAFDGMDEEYYEPGMDDDPLFEEVDNQQNRQTRGRRKKGKKNKTNRRSVFESEADDEDLTRPEPAPAASVAQSTRSRGAGSPFSRREPKVVNLHSGNGANQEFVIFRPNRFEDGATIVDHMRLNRIVLVNEEFMANDEARRITDFLSGAAYALSGILLRVGSLKAVVFTPNGVGLVSEQMDELENSIVQF